jgi:hypothetical protein
MPAEDAAWKASVIDGAIAQRRFRLKLFAGLLLVIWIGAFGLIPVAAAMGIGISAALEAIGGGPLASLAVATFGSLPTVRECLDQWSAIRSYQDLKRGYEQTPSEPTLQKLDEVFWGIFSAVRPGGST